MVDPLHSSHLTARNQEPQAQVAHRLKNSLGLLIGYAELLREDLAGEELSPEALLRSIKAIQRAAQKADRLIEEIWPSFTAAR